jgi:hypothetical protein
MTNLFILVLIIVFLRFLPSIFQFIMSLFIVHIIKLTIKFALISGLVLFGLYVIVR